MAGSRRLTELSERVVAAVDAALDDPGAVDVALSGGADSAMLAWAIVELGASPVLLHVHHGWDASDRLERAAAAVAARLSLELTTMGVDSSGPGSPEAVAREARYEALESLRGAGRVVATGHTSTDQAETVLGNLMWGSGLDGLRGIRRKGHGLVRPLLDVSRATTRELATLLDLPFVDDPANLEVRFRRVRIRRALAEWELRLAPGMADRLASMARLADEDLSLLDASPIHVRTGVGWASIPTGELRSLAPAAARRAIRMALREVLGGHPGSHADAARVLTVANGGAPAEIGGGLRVERVGAHTRIGAPGGDALPPPAEWEPGSEVRWGGWTLSSELFTGRPSAYPLSQWAQIFDAGRFTTVPWRVRAAQGDDHVALRAGRKRVREALAEAGVPVPERRAWPVLEVGGDVLWVPGVRRADDGWVSADTGRYLVVSARREGRWTPDGS